MQIESSINSENPREDLESEVKVKVNKYTLLQNIPETEQELGVLFNLLSSIPFLKPFLNCIENKEPEIHTINKETESLLETTKTIKKNNKIYKVEEKEFLIQNIFQAKHEKERPIFECLSYFLHGDGHQSENYKTVLKKLLTKDFSEVLNFICENYFIYIVIYNLDSNKTFVYPKSKSSFLKKYVFDEEMEQKKSLSNFMFLSSSTFKEIKKNVKETQESEYKFGLLTPSFRGDELKKPTIEDTLLNINEKLRIYGDIDTSWQQNTYSSNLVGNVEFSFTKNLRSKLFELEDPSPFSSQMKQLMIFYVEKNQVLNFKVKNEFYTDIYLYLMIEVDHVKHFLSPYHLSNDQVIDCEQLNPFFDDEKYCIKTIKPYDHEKKNEDGIYEFSLKNISQNMTIYCLLFKNITLRNMKPTVLFKRSFHVSE
jgi:hypothetical protein